MKLPKQLRPLATMRAALLILAALAIASVAGTFVTQQLPTEEYITVYGPFWTEVFGLIGLFDVYRAPWFVALLAILLTSVTSCLFTNGPGMWRQLQKPKRVPGAKALSSWEQTLAPKNYAEQLAQLGFRKIIDNEAGELWRQGAPNRIGYYFTHIGIVLLCIAGLLTAGIGWQGMVILREGESTNTAHVIRKDAMREKELPFTLHSEGFSTRHFPSGMPSQHQTELRATIGGQQTTHTVAVNHPIRIADYRIYQTSFGDGASAVTVTVQDLFAGEHSPQLQGNVYQTLSHPFGGTIELTDYRLTTVESVFADAAQKAPEFRDFGPSLDYTVTVPDRAPRLLRSYQNVPNLVAVADDTGNFAPLYLGLRLDEPLGWATVSTILQNLPNGSSPTELLQQHAHLELSQLPELERLDTAFKILQAVQVLSTHDLRTVLQLHSSEQRQYSALMVRYDPGATLFWVASVLLSLGVLLMVYFHYRRIWVISNTLYLRSNRGKSDCTKLINQLG